MNTSLINIVQLEQEIFAANNPLLTFKQYIKTINEKSDQQFDDNFNIVHLIHERSHAIDDILIVAWKLFSLDAYPVALVAVGGYGRAELHPKSDIDILILHDDEQTLNQTDSVLSEAIQKFITMLWDMGLDIGQSVRTVNECINEASKDITVISNLMESRLICGVGAFYEDLKQAIEPKNIWPTKDFVHAKMLEQTKRHQKFNDTAYNLEPNIKEGPGGLRDIQFIGWITKRHFRASTLKELVNYQFLSLDEYNLLEKGQSFLWKIRYALHRLSRRAEERLLFDYQRELAEQLGYKDSKEKLSVEQFMGDYYQNIMELERLSEILLQYFNEVILQQDDHSQPKKINNRFVVYKSYLSTINDNVFRNYPFALLEIFLILSENPEIKGVRASTIRQIRAHRYLIDDSFRKDLRCRSLFMEIMRQKSGITKQMRRMNRYGVLAEYIPAFKQIVGQMQHDLYHAYTVDEHTLKVLRNVRRISVDEFSHELPLASQVFLQIQKPELLYLAAIFHDIGKGRGGNHSELGAVDAEQFCQLHDLSSEDIRLVSWLVKNHLDMSMVAQRKDLGDPQVIHGFALKVQDMTHLNYLYLLTIADICATSPKVWNSWKDNLLQELYRLTRQALGKGLENPLEQKDKIEKTKSLVILDLKEKGIFEPDFAPLWQVFPKDYFLQHNVQEIVWHTENIKQHLHTSKALVSLRNLESKGSTEILIFMPSKTHVFALVTSLIAQMMMNVTEANTYRTSDGFILHTYHILDEHGGVLNDEQIKKLKDKLENKLSEEMFDINAFSQSTTRTLKQFALPTEITFSEDLENNWTIMHLTAVNRAFVLSIIGYTLIQHEVHLVNARISTFGEKIEDVFYITDLNNQIITNFQTLTDLKNGIIENLDEMVN